MDFEPPVSHEEREATEKGAVANYESMEISSPSSAKEPSPPQSSSSSDVEETAGDHLKDLNVEQLQVLLYKAEAKARVLALQNLDPSPPSWLTWCGSTSHEQIAFA